MKYILAIDQGTTSSRAILFDETLNEISKSQKEFTQIFPRPGWVEHNAEEIFETQVFTCKDAVAKAKIHASQIACIGIANQRETVVVWNKQSGKPIYNAIVWQDRRTANMCEELKSKNLSDYIQQSTGLIIDAYFSATKIKWILDTVAGARKSADENKLLCGTIDTWLLWKLTNGKIHATDFSNASRTMLYNIKKLKWDKKLLTQLNIPENILPEVKNSSDNFGATALFHNDIPICGIAGDQQAALFGQKCFTKGETKNTYGTGCFMLMHTGNKFILSESKLLTTIACAIENKITYALEGSVFNAGAAVQWLRDKLQIIQSSAETEKIAASLTDNGGVYFVPAFTGLGAPHWNMYARGNISGLTRGTNKNHIVRAALEAIAYQTRDVLEAMNTDSNISLKELKVDGGATANNWLMQFQSDILQVPVMRSQYAESTAKGAAMLAGIQAGLFTIETIQMMKEKNKIFIPKMKNAEAEKLYAGWKLALKKSIPETLL